MEGMEFFTPHGTHPAARELGTHLWVNVVVELDATDAIQSDDLEDTVDISDVYEVVNEVIETKAWRLLESLAGHIAARLVELDRVQRAIVSAERHDTGRPGFRAYRAEVTRDRGAAASKGS